MITHRRRTGLAPPLRQAVPWARAMLQRDRAVVIDCETTIAADAKADSTRDPPALMADLRLRVPVVRRMAGFPPPA